MKKEQPTGSTSSFGSAALRAVAGKYAQAIPGAAEAVQALEEGRVVVLDLQPVINQIAAESTRAQGTSAENKPGPTDTGSE